MSTIDTIRPNATAVSGGWSAAPSGTLHGVTSDDSDSTYASGAGTDTTMRLGTPTHTPAANHERHRYRTRIRASADFTTNLIVYEGYRLTSGGNRITPTAGGTISPAASPTSFASPWLTNLPAAGTHDFEFAVSRQQFLTNERRVYELYLDIDTREKPSFTADVYDHGGTSRDGGTITDTNRALITFEAPAYDGLNARSWTLEVTDDATGAVVYTASGTGQPPSSILIDPLADGNYTADLQIFSTIRQNASFGSDVEQVTFEIDFTPPVPPLLTVTPNGCDQIDGPHVEVCWEEDSPGATAFDADPVVEVQRTDCHGQRSIYVAAEPDGCHCDRFAGVTEDPFFCAERHHSLVMDGAGIVETPDSAGLSITGDIDIRVFGRLVLWESFPWGNYNNLVAKWQGGAQESFHLTARDVGDLWFQWNDGSSGHDVFSDVLPVDAGELLGVRVTLDVDDGGDHTVTFYTSSDGATWTQLGNPQTFTGTTQIDDTTAPLQIGSKNGGDPMVGEVHWVEVRDGIGGTVVADPRFTDAPWQIGDEAPTARSDAAGNTWTLMGNAEIKGPTCIIIYRVRYWGEVNGALVSTEWSLYQGAILDNPNPGEAWLRGAASGDMAICPDPSYSRTRPFGAFQPIGGGLPTVVTGDPGGRDYQLVFPVTSEADLVAVEAILAQALVFYQPSDQADLWLAPNSESVAIVNVKRIREVSVSFTAVDPQPVADPESFF